MGRMRPSWPKGSRMGVRRREPLQQEEDSPSALFFCSKILGSAQSQLFSNLGPAAPELPQGRVSRFTIQRIKPFFKTFRVSCGQIWDSTVLNGQT